MNRIASVRSKTSQAQSNWLAVIDQAIAAAEAAELDLSRQGENDPSHQRKASGSYYTPADVAAHFWDLFFRHHQITDLGALLKFLASAELVEPSAGSGMFVFSFFKKAALLGATPENLSSLRLHVIDINLAALRFFSEQLREIEKLIGVRFDGIGLVQHDFLRWAKSTDFANAVFVGNPPFVANPRGARWRNLYADFVEAMLSYRGVKGVSLILPLSVCFSRDYADLRTAIRSAGLGVSASSYDNIPDCLFKSGKPDSTNSNRANSQRCTILNLGGPNPNLREASALLSWASAERADLLGRLPTFRLFGDDDPSGQFPRPASELLAAYLSDISGARPLRSFLSKIGRPAFAVGGVARNYIGLRDHEASGSGCIPIKLHSKDDHWIVLQILSSKLFYEYWRTYGDGFHVTVDLIDRFPVTSALEQHLEDNREFARNVWSNRQAYAKEKLNSGRLIRSYDFRTAFD